MKTIHELTKVGLSIRAQLLLKLYKNEYKVYFIDQINWAHVRRLSIWNEKLEEEIKSAIH